MNVQKLTIAYVNALKEKQQTNKAPIIEIHGPAMKSCKMLDVILNYKFIKTIFFKKFPTIGNTALNFVFVFS